jgi:hypothetical protein
MICCHMDQVTLEQRTAALAALRSAAATEQAAASAARLAHYAAASRRNGTGRDMADFVSAQPLAPTCSVAAQPKADLAGSAADLRRYLWSGLPVLGQPGSPEWAAAASTATVARRLLVRWQALVPVHLHSSSFLSLS